MQLPWPQKGLCRQIYEKETRFSPPILIFGLSIFCRADLKHIAMATLFPLPLTKTRLRPCLPNSNPEPSALLLLLLPFLSMTTIVRSCPVSQPSTPTIPSRYMRTNPTSDFTLRCGEFSLPVRNPRLYGPTVFPRTKPRKSSNSKN